MARASISITYGEYRHRVAAWTGKDPADVTAEDAAAYDRAHTEEER